MRASRMRDIPGFVIDKVAAAAGEDPEVLRMENLDTDLPPPPGVIEATQEAVERIEYSSWLPFSGRSDLKEAVADHVEGRSGVRYDPGSEIVIAATDGASMLDALLAMCDPGNEVVLTDPTYAGMINRVRLAGAVPRFAACRVQDGRWRLDLDSLRDSVTDKTKALFLQNATFPTGMVLNDEEWQAIVDLVLEKDLLLIYWALMEGIVFDGAPIIHPASFEGMRERTITLGSVSIEYRMIGWRVAWAVAEPDTADALGVVHIYNGLVASGFCQAGAVAALRSDPQDFHDAVAEFERRRDAVMEELDDLPAVAASGGWALLLDTEAMGISPRDASARLLKQKIAATPMTVWGETVAPRYIRFVFSREPVERIRELGARVRKALT
ncbi:MAG: pyridoxal phosphate-dependent aminotransferase [Actinomycetota bacterium]|nr:pyridoxal phosphate-dependent aminotransferase [Actinomycetota bacterium]